jgi:hypothetical protein
MPNTYTELRKTTVGTATSSVTLDLTGISGYTDLIVVATMPSSGAVTTAVRFNSDTATNYSTTLLVGSAGGAASYRESNKSYGITGGLVSGLGANSNFILHIQNYANTNTFKTILSRSNSATNNEVGANVILYRSTSAITSINFIDYNGGSNTYPVGSTFSLYGIANADQGAAKATGGIITEDSQYWYHTFAASSAFIPKQSLTCDVLVVAGGGGGGGGASGNGGGSGGGAGGVLLLTSQSLAATSHNVTVGSGGAGGSGANGTVGNDSQLGSLTLVKGGGFGVLGVSGTGRTGGTGGSGGGGGFGTGTGGTAGSNTSGQGFNGGAGFNYELAGGGGGAGEAGNTDGSATGGDGTNAYSSWIIPTSTGLNGFFAGGGSGGGGTTRRPGGDGGGGQNGGAGGSNGDNGVANVGGGGGGGGDSYYYGTTTGGTGGSGVVIVRYAK